MSNKTNKSVVRNAQYKRGGLSVRQRHNERQNIDYMNDDIIKDRAVFNVHFKQAQGSYEQMFDSMLADKTISTRGLGKDPFIVDELVFDVNTSYFEERGGYEYAKAFYEEAYRCAIKEIGGEEHILSAVMHADERNKALSEQLGRDVFHYHLHVVYVPVVRKEIYFKKNNKDPELAGKLREVIMQVSHSKKWPKHKQLDENGEVKRNAEGKAILLNSYSLLQDHFFEHMQKAGFEGFERGERGSTAEHLSVLEYKTKQEIKRAAAATAMVEQKQETAANLDKETEKKRTFLKGLEKKTAVLKGQVSSFTDIDRIGERKTFRGDIAVNPNDWKTVSNLAKEGIKSRNTITEQHRKITGLEKDLAKHKSGGGIIGNLKYYEAQKRAPRRMADTIADIMRKPPEQAKQQELQREADRNQKRDMEH